MTPFKNLIHSVNELREVTGQPSELVRRKVIAQLDSHARTFIAASPLLFLATADAEGRCDVSPRGDAPGVAAVLDDTHLLIPERPGNRRLDSLTNILQNPHVGLIFVIPGLDETLRINGQAVVVRDAGLLTPLAVQGRAPELGIGVTVEECYVHCAKSFRRSRAWHSDQWLAAEKWPDIPQILADQAGIEGYDRERVAERLDKDYRDRLY